MRIKPVTNEIYHVFNRGVEKRKVFIEDTDYLRFIHDLFEFNDNQPAINLAYHIGGKNSKEVGLPKIKRRPRKLLVEILLFCLMPNHFHLMLRQKRDSGITEFMRKLGTGYTNYFNQKNERVGPLFQGKYKSVLINEEPHFMYLPYYIHSNPIGLLRKDSATSNSMKFLENYRWSSFSDYIGKKNFPSVTSREFLLDFFGGEQKHKKEMQKWIKEDRKNKNIFKIKNIKLD